MAEFVELWFGRSALGKSEPEAAHSPARQTPNVKCVYFIRPLVAASQNGNSLQP